MLESMREANTVCKTYEHFNLPGHTNFSDITVTLIDKTDPRNPTEREEKITDIPLKLKHLWVLMLKMVS